MGTFYAWILLFQVANEVFLLPNLTSNGKTFIKDALKSQNFAFSIAAG